eukprot:scaffold14_cov130-Cylindrotheca_fusiformis.AAC.5
MGKTLFEAVANATGNYSMLLELVNDTGVLVLLAVLKSVASSHHSVVSSSAIFGPNDAAFIAVNDTIAGMSNTDLLPVLAGHVVKGTYTSSDVMAAGCVELETLLGGGMISVSYDNETETYLVNNATTIVEPVILTNTFVACPTVEGSSDAPTGAPAGSPTPAPGPGDSSEDAVSVVGTSIAMIVSAAAAAAVFAL